MEDQRRTASRDRREERYGNGRSSQDGDRGRKKHRSRSPRERIYEDQTQIRESPPRRHQLPDDDLSPPRDQIQRPPRHRQLPDSDLSPPRDRNRRGRERSPDNHRRGGGRFRTERRGGDRGDWGQRRGEQRGERERRPLREEDRGGRQDRTRSGASENRQRRRRSQEPDPSRFEFGRPAAGAEERGEEEAVSKDEPNFAVSGKLAAETNTYKGVVINYSEPDEARIPKTRWRLYGFKGEETLPTFFIHRQSAYLVGRDRRVCDIPMDHPSCSKQHAVLQYRLVEYTKDDGRTGKRVKPYLIDLGSTNGSYINNERVESARYYELKEKDMIKFGFSSREYVILHENSKTEESGDETN